VFLPRKGRGGARPHRRGRAASTSTYVGSWGTADSRACGSGKWSLRSTRGRPGLGLSFGARAHFRSSLEMAELLTARPAHPLEQVRLGELGDRGGDGARCAWRAASRDARIIVKFEGCYSPATSRLAAGEGGLRSAHLRQSHFRRRGPPSSPSHNAGARLQRSAAGSRMPSARYGDRVAAVVLRADRRKT